MHALADSAGAPPVVIAHSRGGQFARAAAVRHPDLTRALITLGSPLTRLAAVHPLLRLEILVLGLAGSLGVPGLLRAGCLWGECCRRMRSQIAGPFPDKVPFLSVYSPDDEVVDWRASQDPAATHREVRSSHSGLISDADVFAVIAAELEHILGSTPSRPVDRDEVSAARLIRATPPRSSPCVDARVPHGQQHDVAPGASGRLPEINHSVAGLSDVDARWRPTQCSPLQTRRPRPPVERTAAGAVPGAMGSFRGAARP
jgi:pimeloyl-ACP methyl ester carboxylesterase